MTSSHSTPGKRMHMACDNNHILLLANYVHDTQSGHVSIMQISTSAHIPTAVHVITLILFALEQLLKLLARMNALSLNSLSLISI